MIKTNNIYELIAPINEAVDVILVAGELVGRTYKLLYRNSGHYRSWSIRENLRVLIEIETSMYGKPIEIYFHKYHFDLSEDFFKKIREYRYTDEFGRLLFVVDIEDIIPLTNILLDFYK